MRPLSWILLAVGLAFGLAAEWTSYEHGRLLLAVADLAVGSLLIGCGVVAWDRRPESRAGALMWLTGFTWFLGTVFQPALYLHRGPLVHLVLSYPTGRLSTRPARIVVAAAYVDSAIEPLAGNDWVTLVLSGAVALTALQAFRTASGPARKAAGLGLAAAVAFSGVLVLGAIDRVAGWGPHPDAALWAYDIVIACTAVALTVDLLRAPWAAAVVTGLVVDLGSGTSDSLRATLARALGDPSLVVGYRVPETGELVDDSGLPVELPAPGSGRVVTSIEDRGAQIAVLVHDEALLDDWTLLEPVAAAARVAMSNATLQAETRVRADEIDASRRRIVEVGDAQRRRLEEKLRLGAERRLERVEVLLGEARLRSEADRGLIDTLETELAEARRELREFALGIHPTVLADRGLVPALTLLAERLPLPATMSGDVGRLAGTSEAALYFVCSEAVANTVKHAGATRVWIDVRHDPPDVVLEVSDDGVGGADPARGTGLTGLADRIEALGGRLGVDSPAGVGTRLRASLPVTTSGRA